MVQHDEATPMERPLSWRDVYTAVGQMEERLMKTLERIEEKFDNVVGDHESRLRTLETSGSYEAQEALRTAKALGEKYDTLKARVDAYDARERGIFGTMRVTQQTVLLVFGGLGALSILMHLFGAA